MNMGSTFTREMTQIRSYGSGGFLLETGYHQGSLWICGDKSGDWEINDVGEITTDSLMPILEENPDLEIVLIGTGAQGVLLPANIKASLKRLGVGVDAMDTGAACRTYNILASEARRVAAALIAIE